MVIWHGQGKGNMITTESWKKIDSEGREEGVGHTNANAPKKKQGQPFQR